MENVSISWECSSYGNRSGFVHEVTGTTSEGRVVHKRIQYYNRTWEAYPFQTAKRCAVDILIHTETDEDCAAYKARNHCTRLPRGYRKSAEEFFRAKYKAAYDHIDKEWH